MEKNLSQSFVINPNGDASSSVTIQGPLVGINNIGDLVNILMKVMIPLSGVVLFFIIIWGGYDVLMSRGNAESVASGQKKITAGIVGFILLVSSYFIAKLLGFIFGIGGGII